ncbi:hypothetical protein [Arthrobacter sp. Hiyo1]|uniref:hypothetical protein n=1 Tax=Arthrobacter sp. Hiyo1 TaxID=1588020 RepID=UPI00075112B0|nr:hypothetical protein [Arthrobacter sp. Hiyo1]
MASMEVVLTIGPLTGPEDQEDRDLYQRVKAEADDYEAALTLARDLVPDGFRVLNIRTDR